MKPPRKIGINPREGDLHNWSDQISKVLGGNVSFGTGGQDQNILGSRASGTTPGPPDTEFAVAHSLGYVPQGWVTLNVNKAGVLYKSTTPWTATNIYLKCNVASVNYLIFVV